MNPKDIKGRAIVTGANGGMGQIFCRSLLEAGYKVAMISRPQIPTSDFYKEMVRTYGEERVSLYRMDLSDISSIKGVVKQLIDEAEPIDILINNAGMMGWKPQVAKNGFEMHNMVNCFGPMFFTKSLYPLLHKGSRVINTVSVTVWIGKIRDSFPYPPKRFNRFERYSDSKLALQLLSLRLADEWKTDNIAVNTMDPGIVDTKIIQLHNNLLDRLCDMIYRPLIKTPEEGAETGLFLALDPSVEGKTGGLYKNRRQKKINRFTRHKDADKVWEILENMDEER